MPGGTRPTTICCDENRTLEKYCAKPSMNDAGARMSVCR